MKGLTMDIQLPGLIQLKGILEVAKLLSFLIQAQALFIFQPNKLMIFYTDY
jgi:hypothetical protein